MKKLKKRHPLSIAFLFYIFYLAGCNELKESYQNVLPCLEDESPVNMNEDYIFPGDMIFRSNEKGEIIALNGETHKITTLFRVNDGDFWDASPLTWDGKSLVLSSYSSNVSADGVLSLIIISYQGNIKQVKIPIAPDSTSTYSWRPSEWINEQHLLSGLYGQDDEGNTTSEVLLLNPFVPNVQKFTDFVKTEIRGDGEEGFLVSPDMTKVLFINNQYYLTLSDVILQKKLWTYEKDDGAMMVLGTNSLGDTIWSKTGDVFLIPVPLVKDTVNGTTILFVSHDGEIVNFIDFENYQHGFSWNSDENLLAFYGYECNITDCTTGYKTTIRVPDTDTNIVNDLCSLDIDTEPTSANATGRIVWSPDNSALVFSSFSIRSIPGTFLIKKLDDPNLISIPINPYKYTLLGWSPYHWEEIK